MKNAMGSQTLDIFRQGVWASLTGGWFYDPNQGVFCNAVHLYIWLFFLCGPFFTYLYSPTFIAWIVYVSATATTMTVLKAVNMGLHFVYDQSHMLSEASPNGTNKCKENSGDCNGIEMQILDNTQSAISENRMFERDITDSIASLDCGNNNNSTIDFKVDVHRKNSSGSNESVSLYASEILASTYGAKSKSDASSQPKMRKYENNGIARNEVLYLCPLKSAISEEGTASSVGCSPVDDHVCDESKCKQTVNSILNDSEADASHWNVINVDPQMPTRLRRSTRSGISDEIKKLSMSPKNTHNNSKTASEDLHLFTGSKYGESDLEIENLDRRFLQQCEHMQKAQSGTISTLHLPSVTFNNSKTYKRRHSNACSKSAAAASVIGGGVRRIKSAAHDISHLQTSVTNLPSYPNSIEVIPERPVKNSTGGPMQSKLTRNTYMNFCSKMDGLAEVGNALCEEDYYHPKSIAERNIFGERNVFGEKDNMACSMTTSSGKCVKKINKLGKKCCSIAESDLCRPQTESTGSESEINGSSSPLLNESKFLDANDSEPLGQNSCELGTQYKTEDSGCPSSDCEQTSEGSKDMLLSKDESSSNLKSVISMDFDRKMQHGDEKQCENPQPAQFSSISKDLSKNLGAVPKVLKRYDEPAPIPNRSVSLKGVFHRSLSCDSSSESSRSFSRENVSGHIYRPNNDQWLLQGGPKRSFRVSSARLPLVYTNDVAFGCRPGHGMIEDGMKIAPILRSTESKGEDDLLDEQLEFSKTLDASTSETRQSEPDMPLSIPDFIQFQYQEQLSMRRPSEDTNLNTSDRQFSDPAYCDYWQPCNLAKAKPVPQKRCYKYRLKYFGTKELEISMDRLQLLAIFDRDLNWFHVLLSIVLSTIVCFLGSVVLNLGVYRDICAFIFCLVIASSQYSLLKSVQPDAASPVHGFNKTVAYSRPIYFCLFCGLLLASHYTLDEIQNNELQQYPRTVQIFGITLIVESFCEIMEYSLSIFLLAFPILFSLGLFPQFNTFCMYLLEQIDLHMFGGNAACNLSASILCVVKSILAVCILYGPIFGGLSEEKGTQHVLFSIFCGALISSSYHLSRCTSDFSHIWTLITSNLLKYTEEEEDGDRKSESHRNESDSKNSPRSEKIEDSKENVESSDKGNIMRKRAASSEVEQMDPFIKTFQNTVNSRLKNDLVVCTSIGLLFLALHATTVFTVLQPNLSNVLLSIAIGVGFLLHYLIPQMRKHLPWLCFAHPILKQREYGKFEVGEASQIMWFERLYIYVCFIEKNILYPLIFISALTAESTSVVSKFGLAYASLIVTVCALKAVRSSYSDSTNQYLILVFCWLFFKFDFKLSSETFILDYFVVSIIYRKFCDFLLKVQFVVTYIAPWQITWGSAFHAFAQPFSVPHSAMLFLQASVSAVLSTPLNPFLGSAIFLTSYVRPIKFWERDYNTRRIDHSNTRLSSQLEKDLGADDNNLNSIFYEHLTRSLQHYLCGDLLLGRWGNVNQGDCFVLASDYLNCLVHIIELGNGLCTFQMRGLEFRGTYCQQREVEAISEGVEDDRGCCCCSPGHMPHMLSVNAMFSTRWLAWQVVAAQYVLEGYSISENLATATLQLFEFRKVLITYYVKSIIYYVTQSNKLDEWLAPGPIQEALGSTLSRQFVDLDPIFNYNLDEDFDFRALGITRGSFCCVYLNWIQFCYAKRLAERNMNLNASRKASESCENSESAPSANSSKNFRGNTKNYAEDRPNSENGGSNESGSNGGGSPIGKDSPLVSLCLALGLLARRSLATASHSSLSGVEFFLHGLHALFKGDFRITSPRDEWVFADMELLHGVVAPAVKMGLKLHQDHFSSPDEYLDEAVLYDAIKNNSTQLVISHEADPMWRSAVLRGAPNLLALRHVMEDGCDEYRIIRLTKRFLSFRVIKLNRECVRGLWAGQQQELIYLRNRNPERGSIQNAKQALRNIINSSCDQPIGYPIYVSPLTTSYAETNEQLTQVIGGSLTLDSLQNLLVTYWKRIRNRFQEGCSSGSSVVEADTTTTTTTMMANTCVTHTPGQSGGSMILTRSNQSFPGSTLRTGLTSVNKPTNSALLVGFLNREREQDRESVRDRLTKRSVQLRNVTELNNLSDGMPMLKDFGENPGISRYRQISHPDEICSSAFTSASTSCSGKFTESGEHNILNGLPDGTEQLLVEINKKVIIVNQMEIYDCLDLGRRIDVVWPNEKMRLNGGRSSWKGWFPEEGMVGFVVHYWQPNHPDQRFRSNVNRTLYLVAIEDRFVPVGADGIREYKQIGFTDFTSTPLPLPPPPPLATESKQIVDDTEI